ncbi:hypothetical protein N9018_01530 [Rhodopirellula sp.]|nr:hypothetical protein [Rhodopirellula sp.]
MSFASSAAKRSSAALKVKQKPAATETIVANPTERPRQNKRVGLKAETATTSTTRE